MSYYARARDKDATEMRTVVTKLNTAVVPEEHSDSMDSFSKIDALDLPDQRPISIREFFERQPKMEDPLDQPDTVIAAFPEPDHLEFSEATKHILNLPKISDLKAEMKWLIA